MFYIRQHNLLYLILGKFQLVTVQLIRRINPTLYHKVRMEQLQHNSHFLPTHTMTAELK